MRTIYNRTKKYHNFMKVIIVIAIAGAFAVITSSNFWICLAMMTIGKSIFRIIVTTIVAVVTYIIVYILTFVIIIGGVLWIMVS